MKNVDLSQFTLSPKDRAIVEEMAEFLIKRGLSDRLTEGKTSISFDFKGRSVFHFELEKPKRRGFVPQIGHMRGVHNIRSRWVDERFLDSLFRQLEDFFENAEGDDYMNYPLIPLYKLRDEKVRREICEIVDWFIDCLNSVRPTETQYVIRRSN